MPLNSYMERSEQKMFLHDLYKEIRSYFETYIVKPFERNFTEAARYFEDYGIAPDTGNEEEDEFQRSVNSEVMDKIFKRMDEDTLSFIFMCCSEIDVGDIGQIVNPYLDIDEYTKSQIEELMYGLTGINYDYDRMERYDQLIYMWDTVENMKSDVLEYMVNKFYALVKTVTDNYSKLYSSDLLVNLYNEYY